MTTILENANGQRLPDYLIERLDNSLEVLRAEILDAKP